MCGVVAVRGVFAVRVCVRARVARGGGAGGGIVAGQSCAGMVTAYQEILSPSLGADAQGGQVLMSSDNETWDEHGRRALREMAWGECGGRGCRPGQS